MKIVLKFLGGEGKGYNTYCTEKLNGKSPLDIWGLCNAPKSY